jgi:hypothetical protein
VYDYLQADTDITGNMGVYWLEAPSSAAHPYVELFQVSDPLEKLLLNNQEQGVARIQHTLWDDSAARGVANRKRLRKKLERLNETRDGYTVYTESATEQTLQRERGSDAYQFVVDAVVRWHE